MKLICVVLAFVALVSAETPQIQNGFVSKTLQTTDIREIVEKWTPIISQFIIDNHLDPYALESIEKEFWVPFPGIPFFSYKASFGLYLGELNGLSQLKFHDVTLSYDNRIIKLDLNVELPVVMIKYDYDLKLRIIRPRGTITADAKTVHTNTIITYDVVSYKLDFEKFQLKTLNIGNVAIKNQSGWTYWVLSFIAETVAALNKSNIMRGIETDVTKAIQKQVDEINRNVNPEVIAQFFQNLLLAAQLNN